MDGDFAPLEDLGAIADRYAAFLIVDEAHATGVYGEQGRELTAPYEGRENLLVVHTCGKALGAAGALVSCIRCAARFHGQSLSSIHRRHRTSSLMAIAARAALSIMQEESERQQHLAKLAAFTHRQMRKRGRQSPSGSQIVPYSLATMRAQYGLPRTAGSRFDIRGIRRPTVPVGTACLRISLTLNVAEKDVLAMLDALIEETTNEAQ